MKVTDTHNNAKIDPEKTASGSTKRWRLGFFSSEVEPAPLPPIMPRLPKKIVFRWYENNRGEMIKRTAKFLRDNPESDVVVLYGDIRPDTYFSFLHPLLFSNKRGIPHNRQNHFRKSMRNGHVIGTNSTPGQGYVHHCDEEYESLAEKSLAENRREQADVKFKMSGGEDGRVYGQERARDFSEHHLISMDGYTPHLAYH